jgi:hypothetical protein
LTGQSAEGFATILEFYIGHFQCSSGMIGRTTST